MQAEAAASVLVHRARATAARSSRATSSRSSAISTGTARGSSTRSSHVASEAADLRSGGGGFTYQNHFTCIPVGAAVPPAPRHAQPVGPGNADGRRRRAPGEEIFTDKYGRVKVQFHWDREGKNDADSSCWVRVAQPIAGRRWGASFWPRIGQEVIVDFLEGDPDQPIIVGSVYNADQMPPYLGDGPDGKHKNDNKLTGFKSNTTLGGDGFNEWRFDDTKGKEQVFLHAERNMDTRVKNDSMESVGSNKHLTVGGEKDGQKFGDYKELVYQDVHLHNKGDLEQVVGGSLWPDGRGRRRGEQGTWSSSSKGNRASLVEYRRPHPREEGPEGEVDGGQSLTVGGDQQEKVGQKHALEAGQEIHLKGGMKVVIEAGMQLSLKGPGGFVDIGPSGVTIQGNDGPDQLRRRGRAPEAARAQPRPRTRTRPRRKIRPRLTTRRRATSQVRHERPDRRYRDEGFDELGGRKPCRKVPQPESRIPSCTRRHPFSRAAPLRSRSSSE